MRLEVEISDDNAELLAQLLDEDAWPTLEELVEHLARSAADGVRRPGSWERGWITQATGWAG